MSVAVHHQESEAEQEHDHHHVEVVLKGTSAGLRAEWFAMKSLTKLPADKEFHSATPELVNTVPNLDYPSSEEAFANSGLKNNFAAQFEGYIDIPEAGEWTFFLESDDGSSLFIDDVEVAHKCMQLRSPC